MPFPITVAEIAKTEAKTGFKFPLGLKARLSKDNGGEVRVGDDNWWLIPFLDTTDRKRIARTCNDIVRETTQMRSGQTFQQMRSSLLKTELVTTSSSVLKLRDQKSLAETIYFWDHETGQHEPVADSFDFL